MFVPHQYKSCENNCRCPLPLLVRFAWYMLLVTQCLVSLCFPCASFFSLFFFLLSYFPTNQKGPQNRSRGLVYIYRALGRRALSGDLHLNEIF